MTGPHELKVQTLQTQKAQSFKLFDQIAPTYDFLNHLLSGGLDILWRRKLIAQVPRPATGGLVALDLACGTGDVAIALAKLTYCAKVTGLDLSEGMLKYGNQKLKAQGLSPKAQLVRGDGVQIPCADHSVDLVTLSFGIRNFTDYQASLKDIYRVLKPGGRVLILEFSLPPNRLIRWGYFLYFRHVLPWVGNLVSGHSGAYTYLNQSVEDFAYGKEFLESMRMAGFSSVRAQSLTFGVAALYIGDKAHVV